MSQVSKKKLDNIVHKKISKQLARLSSNLSKSDSEQFHASLFTEVEEIMFAKRLACILMLNEGYSQYVIEKTLMYSSSTVARIAAGFNEGVFDGVIHIFDKKKEEREQFWASLEVLLRAGMPSMGKDRWKHLP